MAKPSAGRAQILSAQVVFDTYGTTCAWTASTANSVLIPDDTIGILFYSPNIAPRVQFRATASTALTWPSSGYFRADTEYAFPLQYPLGTASFIGTIPGTAEVTFIIGVGD